MPDDYWNEVKRTIDKDQEGLLKSGRGRRCTSCGKLFEVSERPESKNPQSCLACHLSPRKLSAWRGKGSYGSKPGEAANELGIEDIVRKIEDGPTG